jgi:aminoglycoside 2''-phosphotransferase
LEQLHTVTLATVPALKVEASIGAYSPLQRHFHRELEDLLTRDEVQKIERVYEVFEADQRNQLLMPSVIHSDLKPAHVLVNDSSGHLSGVLDWGDACLGDQTLILLVSRYFSVMNFCQGFCLSHHNLIEKECSVRPHFSF